MQSYASFSSRHKPLFKMWHVLAVRKRHVQKDNQIPPIQLCACGCLLTHPGALGPIRLVWWWGERRSPRQAPSWDQGGMWAVPPFSALRAGVWGAARDGSVAGGCLTLFTVGILYLKAKALVKEDLGEERGEVWALRAPQSGYLPLP